MSYHSSSSTRAQGDTSSTGGDILSVLSSSKPGSRSLTPSNSLRPPTQAGQPSTSVNVDAFSSLLGASFSNTKNSGNLSLAEKRAAALKEDEARALKERAEKEKVSAVWSGLDMLGQQSSKLAASSSSAQGHSVQQDDWLFDSLKPQEATTSAPPGAQAQAPSQEDDWGLEDFAASSSTAASSQTQPKPLDSDLLLDALADSKHDRELLSRIGQRPSPPTIYEEDNTEDDILGLLGKPVDSVPKRASQSQTTAAQKIEEPKRNERGSPPPHIIGQIVETGFSPDQARLALAATDTGYDVQQALEMLLSNGAGVEDPESVPEARSQYSHTSESRDEDGEYGERPLPPRARRPVRERPSPLPSGSKRNMQTPPLSTSDIQDRADKLLSQASEIGLNMFNRANALFKDGREKVQKVYEERNAKSRPIDGRPRWMVDSQGGPIEPDRTAQSRGFRDLDEPEQSDEEPRRPGSKPESSQARPITRPAAASKSINLFDEEPAVYVSPSRRRPAVSRTGSQTHSTTSTAPPDTQQRPAASALRIRQAVSAGMQVIDASNALKTKGTELFKLGQYAEAEKAYSAALSALPTNHLLVIPLLNNRALSRIKTGEYSGAIEDCTTVLSIIGTDYNPASEAKVAGEDKGSSVDLGDAMLKAYRRRAEALEGREKWDLARKDWEAITRCSWSVKMRADAQSGFIRCRKMTTAEREPPVQAKPKAPPRETTAPATNTEALKRVRQANLAQEEEERTKAKLKDSVDARLIAWKAGKETNIRALVASLENVLWEELEWQKVGLHELISPGQVKVRYMKAIAKLHPDKLNSGNTTVEQRMIANGVFSALNDAWLAFKQ